MPSKRMNESEYISYRFPGNNTVTLKSILDRIFSPYPCGIQRVCIEHDDCNIRRILHSSVIVNGLNSTISCLFESARKYYLPTSRPHEPDLPEIVPQCPPSPN